MTYNNIALVRNNASRSFFSENGHAFVTEDNIDLSGYFCLARDRNTSVIPLKNTTADQEFNTISNRYFYGLIPYTVEVYGDSNEVKEFPPVKFTCGKDITNHSDIEFEPAKIYISRLQPTNIKYTPVSAVVYGDSPLKENLIELSGTTVGVKSKADIVIPNSATYGNMELTVQKNCFIELKLNENVVDVVKLPTALEYIPEIGIIKGTFTKSGMYAIVIKYADGEQIINITVPYYERLL